MAVGIDASSPSHVSGSSSASAASFSWTHDATASARCVLVFVITIASTDNGSSVTYGGAAMNAVPGGSASDTVTEPGTVKTYFLDNVATGNQTVVVNRTNNATAMIAFAVSFTAAPPVGSRCDVYTPGIVLLQEDQAASEQSVSDGTPPTNSMRCACAYSGLAAPPGTGASSTLLESNDLGAFGAALVRETTAGIGSRSVGFSAASDDLAAVHLAVREWPVLPSFAAPPMVAA